MIIIGVWGIDRIECEERTCITVEGVGIVDIQYP